MKKPQPSYQMVARGGRPQYIEVLTGDGTKTHRSRR